MQIALSELKTNAGKYVDLAENEDVFITRNGKQVAKLIGTKHDRVADVQSLFGIAKGTLPPEYNDPGYDPCYKELICIAREERHGT